jgi:hypothetical protein
MADKPILYVFGRLNILATYVYEEKRQLFY